MERLVMTGFLLFLLLCATVWLILKWTESRDQIASLEARLNRLEFERLRAEPQAAAAPAAAPRPALIPVVQPPPVPQPAAAVIPRPPAPVVLPPIQPRPII